MEIVGWFVLYCFIKALSIRQERAALFTFLIPYLNSLPSGFICKGDCLSVWFVCVSCSIIYLRIESYFGERDEFVTQHKRKDATFKCYILLHREKGALGTK